jgi:hypothetical protein
MNPARMLLQFRNALGHLNPNEVRELARKPVSIELSASSPQRYEEMANYFAPAERGGHAASKPNVIDVAPKLDVSAPVIRIVEEGMPQPAGSFVYQRNKPEAVVCDILRDYPDLNLALARKYTAFRKPVSEDVIFNVSKENALFSVATSVPALMPLLAAPWAIGEFASDTAFLTMNQIRMAFMLAAAHDETIGYREQKGEIASMFAGAFGWRAIARELIGVIPMGGGIVPKAGIAFAGTYVVGLSLERLYRVGLALTPDQRKQAYRDALERGKTIATDLLHSYKSQRPG